MRQASGVEDTPEPSVEETGARLCLSPQLWPAPPCLLSCLSLLSLAPQWDVRGMFYSSLLRGSLHPHLWAVLELTGWVPGSHLSECLVPGHMLGGMLWPWGHRSDWSSSHPFCSQENHTIHNNFDYFCHFPLVSRLVQSLSHVRLFATPWTPGFPIHHQLLEFAQIHVHFPLLLLLLLRHFSCVRLCATPEMAAH